jgi:hypothetical protein
MHIVYNKNSYAIYLYVCSFLVQLINSLSINILMIGYISFTEKTKKKRDCKIGINFYIFSEKYQFKSRTLNFCIHNKIL